MSDSKLNLVVQFLGADKLSGSIRNIIGAGKGGANSIRKLRDEVAGLNKQVGKTAEFRKANQQFVAARRNSAAAATELARLKGEIVAGTAPTKGLVRQIQAAEKNLEKMQAAEGKAGAKAKELAAGIKAAGGDVTRLGAYEKKLAADIAATTKKMDAQKASAARMAKLSGIGGKMMAGGAAATAAVTLPAGVFGASAIQASREAAAAAAQVKASLASMGQVAGRTMPQLQDQAGALMRNSLYDDDEIMRKVTANMLTFGKISGTTFDRAQQAAVDLSTKLDGDLQGSTIMIGKALNDPVKGITALTRVGVSFTGQQKEQVKAMAQAGNMAGAQALILKELERQYGGSAKAARDADPGGAMAISYGEFQQAIGDKLLPALTPLILKLTDLLDKFNALSPSTQGMIVNAGLLAVALGPLMTVGGAVLKGFTLLRTAFSIVTVGAQMLIPLVTAIGIVPIAIGAAIAGVAYLIYRYWDKISGAFSAGVAKIKGWWNSAKGAVSSGISSVTERFRNLPPWAKWALAALNPVGLAAMVATHWGQVKGAFGSAIGWLRSQGSVLYDIGRNIMQGLWNGLKSMAGAVWNPIKGAFQGAVSKGKALLGIKSPSRVFMEMGGHMADGMAIGIDRKGHRPMGAVARMVTGAAGAGAMALSGPAMASTGGTAKGAAPGHTFNIYQQPGEDSEALAKRIAGMVDRAQQNRRRSSYQDDF